MNRDQAGSPRNRALGAELREFRKNAQMTVRDLSQHLGGHHSRYARNELGERRPAPEEVAAILTVLGAPEADRDRLTELAREQGSDGNWLKPGSAGTLGIAHELTDLMEFERTASGITDVAPLAIPGLLQSSGYARAVMTEMPPHEVEARVAMRLGRRDVLTRRSDAPNFRAIIDETVLQRSVGGVGVMLDQLHHITAMAERPNVTVQIIPHDLTTWHDALIGMFIYFEFPKAAPIVHLEHLSASAFLYESADVQVYRDAIESISKSAMTAEDSAKVINRRISELEKTA
ncbi:helix-turn-helix domain-containing protein [Saccharopolyspora sp. HNM0986]|uniref:helix-turn-helix domain-containing protein n=1 Tax=Saccharopolyspora galaxeae TaxID=2781241 RepID=UPI00190B7005|nr:helix-turn-helix transcriptional regulator [Saccharopolyspora sp. HNM0986]MBK0865918.1 helix-turn-helix domain-containing protein [Saccharopolyspora sp. HNM0986]